MAIRVSLAKAAQAVSYNSDRYRSDFRTAVPWMINGWSDVLLPNPNSILLATPNMWKILPEAGISVKSSFCILNPFSRESLRGLKRDAKMALWIRHTSRPMLSHMVVLKPYGQYWFVTITPYGKEIEPHVPAKKIIMEDFKKLSGLVGIDSVGWIYDPILLYREHTVEWHIAEFEKMATCLSDYTKPVWSVLLIFTRRLHGIFQRPEQF